MASAQKHPALVLWIVWFAIVDAIVIYQFTIGKGWPTGVDRHGTFETPFAYIAIGFFAIATAIRWLAIPRAVTFRRQFVLLIVGLILSETVEFFGLFLYQSDMPQTKILLFVLALLGSLQFAPIYARRARIA